MLANVSIQRIFSTNELGSAIRQARRERRLTQIGLAQHANVARSAVQKLEEGRGTVNVETALRLLHILSLDLAIAARASASSSSGSPGDLA